ncbi:UNVERIFIED_CONTAM: hypothetical protein FKN15_019928, partial [Acipenser sinensis]
QVCEDEKVSTVWSLVSDRLNIPVNQQGLLYKGKSLAGRLNSTAQHRTAHPSSHPSHHPSSHPGSVWHSLPALLNKHFSPANADYERRLHLLSLDDMERLATRMLHPEAVECMELSFLD